MAIGYVGANAGSGSSTAVTVTRTVTTGNLLVLALGHTTGTETITNAGGQTWTQQVAFTPGQRCIIWTATSVTTGSITVDITKGTSGAFSVCMAEFNDHDSVTPVVATDGESNASGTSKIIASPAITPPTDGAFFGAVQHSGTVTAISFTSATQITTSGRGLWCYRLGAFAEDGAYTHTTSVSSVTGALSIAPAGGGGGGSGPVLGLNGRIIGGTIFGGRVV